jgi:hypothetical protein
MANKKKPVALGIVFGVGMAVALQSWLLGIMFGVLFYGGFKLGMK